MYVILGLNNALFWSAIWILFYLRFTNYAGIGIIESVMITTSFVAEIPTGAIADLLGKKGALIGAFLFGAIGNFLMGTTGSFEILLLAVGIMTIGGALLSGTAEALIYDTLLSIKQEKKYEKIIGNNSTIKMIVIALSSIVGGVMYSFAPGLPFIALGVVQLLSIVLCLFLIEPPIDSEKFSLVSYIKQTKFGFLELFRSKGIAFSSLTVIALTMITLINGHFLIDAQLVAQGWNEKELGIIGAIMFFLSAGIAQLTPVVSARFGKQVANIMAALSIVLTMLFIPMLGTLLATIVIMSRNGLLEVFGNTANAIINQNVRSQYRATALSSYNMLASIPYVVTAFLIGSFADNHSVNSVTVWLGVGLGALAIVGLIVHQKTLKTHPKEEL